MARTNYSPSIITLALITAAAFIIIFYATTRMPWAKVYNAPQAEQLITQYYQDINGFSIEPHERKKIEEEGGNCTYGEITFAAVEAIITECKNHLTADKVFYDLGCGVGKACMQVALRTPARAVGIELSSSRYQAAQKAKDMLIKNNVLTDAHKLEFREQNMLHADLAHAGVVFLCSTCFSDQLMQQLADKIAQLNTNLCVATLRQLPETSFGTFSLIKTLMLPMTWSNNSTVYIYKRMI